MYKNLFVSLQITRMATHNLRRICNEMLTFNRLSECIGWVFGNKIDVRNIDSTQHVLYEKKAPWQQLKNKKMFRLLKDGRGGSDAYLQIVNIWIRGENKPHAR